MQFPRPLAGCARCAVSVHGGALDLCPHRFPLSTDEGPGVASQAEADPREPLMGLLGESLCCFLEMCASR